MALNGFVDGELDMMCEGLFDNIEDLLDFSTDDEALGIDSVDGGYQQIAPPCSAPPPIVSIPSLNGEESRVTAASEDTKICEDINIGEDWITNFLDDSNFDLEFPAANPAIIAAAPRNDDQESLFRSFSPVSVLEEPINLGCGGGGGGGEKLGGSSSFSSSSSSSSSSSFSSSGASETACLAPVGPTMMLVPGRARSKRPRRAAHVSAPILPPASEGPPAVPTFLLPECGESFGESSPSPAATLVRKKKKKNNAGVAAVGEEEGAGGGGRRCQHCGIQKTPQWRAGPTGPKTLCNACGVRYKSGRLFPEYRPAASPTFVPSIHSNSHKKVVEMRNRACQQRAAAHGAPSPEYPAAKNCDLLAYIRRS